MKAKGLRLTGTFGFILSSVVLSAAAQLSLKAGVSSYAAQAAFSSQLGMRSILLVVTQPMIIFGLLLYAASAASWLGVLARMEVSSAYPFVALAIVLTSLLGWFFFEDTFSTGKIFGTLLIVVGVATLAYNP